MLNDIMIENPRPFGYETEFFLQSEPASQAHIHNVVEFLYVKEGSCTVNLDNIRYEIGVGDLILFCSNAVHSVIIAENAQCLYYVIKIPPSVFLNVTMHSIGIEYAMRFAINRRQNKCLWRREELEGSEIKCVLDALISEHRQQRYASDLAIKLKIVELLLAILRYDIPNELHVNDQSIRLIYSAMNYVQERYAEDISESELAKSFGFSYSYFSRTFKRVTGMTFKKYLTQTRISKANKFLSQNNLSISEIAAACGYNSVSYFINIYRSVTGETPYKAMRGLSSTTDKGEDT